ncbi:hypothetical protein ABW20_dc0104899 [Dactylellina cionopaga]|nr:hypothetical protein ABW20_dc0104899 [Dactylellina cionopaga]
MRQFYAYVGLALLGGVSAQTFPTCAYSCLPLGLQQTTCSETDIRCLCQSRGWIDTVATCIRSACSAADAESAGLYSRNECAAFGISVSISPASSTTSGGGGVSVSTPAQALTITGGAVDSTAIAVGGHAGAGSQTSLSTSVATPASSGGGAASQSSSSAPSSHTSTSGSSSNGNSGGNSAGDSGGSGSSPSPAPSGGGSGGGSSTNVGPIVGGVIGGVVALAALGVLGFWLMKREKRKKMELEMAGGGLPAKPPMAADANNQGIWTGDNTYSWNPSTNTYDVQGGTPLPR